MTSMTTAEKLTMIKTFLKITGTGEDTRITAYLTAAEREILTWRYSYASGDEVTALPAEFDMVQVHAVIAGYTQAGAEGQRVHNENGTNVTFNYSDMLDYIRANVIPLCRVI